MYKICILFLCLNYTFPDFCVENPDILRLKITDQHKKNIFGVYIALQRNNTLLTVSDMDGECVLKSSNLSCSDTLIFQGLGYVSQKITVKHLLNHPVIRLKELKYDLSEATVQGMTTERLLKIVSDKLKKQKVSRIPVCRYFGPAQYEKITQCRDTTVEYRREYGFYFTSGNIIPDHIWDKTFRSYLVPQYMARSYNFSPNGDTIIPLFLTKKNVRFDIGTRKIFTLTRAIQLYGPLFNERKYYEIHPVNTDSSDYIFSFQTRPEAYPDNIRISCKGIFSIDRINLCLKKIEFDYIDYQLLRQILLTNQQKTTSPFSTKATLSFATNTDGETYIRSCQQTTLWKYDLGENFILIEQPSRDLPGLNRLIEKEAFYCYDYLPIKSEWQTSKILTKIHLAHRYPTGTYLPEVFNELPSLLDTKNVQQDLGRYMRLEYQFRMNSDKPYYPENYLAGSDIDLKERANYLKNLAATRQYLFEIFGNTPLQTR